MPEPPSDPRLNPPTIDAPAKDRFDLWLSALRRDINDPPPDRVQTIGDQILLMMWDAACFEMVLEGRECARKDERGRLCVHAPTHRLLDRLFIRQQMLAFRRLIDRPNASKPARRFVSGRSVYSLVELLDDMIEHRELLSRSNLCALHGYLLDTAAAHEAFRDCLLDRYGDPERDGETSECGEIWAGIPLPDLSDAFHQAFDKIVDPRELGRERSTNDLIAADVLVGLRDHIVPGPGDVDHLFSRIKRHVDKFIAHASSPASIADLPEDKNSLLTSEISDARDVICRVYTVVYGLLTTSEHYSLLPMPRDDVAKHCEGPIAPADHADRLRDRWKRFDEHAKKLASTRIEWLLEELRSDGSH